jgi:pyruvate/2-oxoglutarate dehydrogenase complex dihydrolipoamide acyltransferase (E2) component
VAKVTMPQLGESVAEGTIGKWLKKPGDTVEKYEPLLEVITDKVNAEVPSPFAGVLREILVEEGATVPNNAEIAVIETADEAGSSAQAPAAEAPAAAATNGRSQAVASTAAAPAPAAPAASVARPAPSAAAGPAGSDESADRPERAAASAAAPPPTAVAPAPTTTAIPALGGEESEGRMTPAVRRLLREHGLTAAQIVGTGGGGRVTREDVTNYVESQRTGKPVNGQPATAGGAAPTAPAPQPAAVPAATRPASAAPAPAAPPTAPTSPIAALPAPSGARGIGGQQVAFPDGADEVLVPMTQMRKGIAAQMTRALQVPHAYVQVEVDATRLVKLREARKQEFHSREGTSLSYVPFVTKAVVEALKRNPAFNAHWTEQGLVAKRRINMGVAVALPDGLIVPVVHDVDQLSVAGINRAIAEVAARARANKLRLDDIQGSTFTIDNTGWFGSNITLPIINVPEVAILTMENITKRPVVVETPEGDVIAIRPVMNMVVGIDHRANDGAQAAAFLNDVKRWLESVDADLPLW